MAYGTDSGLTNYASARGITLEQSTDILLTLAHDYLESLDYIGERTDPDQTDQWPRTSAYIYGEEIDNNIVPQDIIDSEYQIAISIDQGNDPAGILTQAIKAESVDTISIEYQDGSTNTNYDRRVFLKLRRYLVGSSGATNVIKVSRA